MSDICVKGLCKSYNEKVVLSDLNYVFKEGSFTCIMGESGVGKTTLLGILMGIVSADFGSVSGLDGKKISAVFQENRLCENITAWLNVKLVTGPDSTHSEKDIEHAFEIIGLEAKDKRTIDKYSGGMKRRVAILRALMADYDVLILDEPLKGLDAETYTKTAELIKSESKGKTVIFVTHDKREAELFDADVFEM